MQRIVEEKLFFGNGLSGEIFLRLASTHRADMGATPDKIASRKAADLICGSMKSPPLEGGQPNHEVTGDRGLTAAFSGKLAPACWQDIAAQNVTNSKF
jgi:hypothetical protein